MHFNIFIHILVKQLKYKQIIKYRIIFLSLLIGLASCVKEDNLISNIQDSSSKTEQFLISQEIEDLTSNDAKKVALQFRNEGNAITRSDELLVNIASLNDSINNTPLIYIVNWPNSRGYVIISATKKYAPILGYADSGSFKIDKENPSFNLIQSYQNEIVGIMNDNSESSRQKHALNWALFEHNNTQTRSTESIDDKIQNEIRKKEALGYQYLGKLSILNYWLPQEEAEMTKKIYACIR